MVLHRKVSRISYHPEAPTQNFHSERWIGNEKINKKPIADITEKLILVFLSFGPSTSFYTAHSECACL